MNGIALILLCALAAAKARSAGHVPHPDLRTSLRHDGPIAPKPQPVRVELGEILKNGIDVKPSIVDINEEHMEHLGLVDGDILEPKQDTRNTIVDDSGLFWPTRQVPVKYSNEINLLAKAAIDEARREFELRTCFSFPERVDEENYILFEPLNGCYSSIGMQTGEQTISIGNRCEEMYTVVHEIIHALGALHEQSRADRDDYVEIKWANIIPSTVFNFRKSNFNATDDRRVAYDYDSIMHYYSTAFTNDGNVTIQPRDPAFTDLIGQQSTFSYGDVTKIQRMYNCSDTVRISYTVNFEEESVGGYSEYNTNSDAHWLRHEIPTSDTTGATTRYLPAFDSTFGVDGAGSFIYLDTSNKFPGLAGSIKSMRYRTTVAHQCLEFSYFVDLDPNSQAALTVYIATIDPTTGVITSYGAPVQTFTGSYGQVWNVHRMTVSSPETYRLVFSAKTGGYPSDVIAVDDVSMLDKECDTSYFLVPDYSSKLESPMGEPFISSTMHTGYPGYAFQVVVYPTGNETEGYMSIYFRLVGGDYDDQLEWPFDKQFIRLVITDQSADALTRMNYYNNFFTNASSTENGEAWQKPSGLGVPNMAVGFDNYMKNTRWTQFNRMYLKHDTAYFSVQVTDMRPYADGNTDVSAQLKNPVLRSAREFPSWDDMSEDVYDKDRRVDENRGEVHGDGAYTEDENDGMISVGLAAVIVLATCGSVFLIMSVVICCVVRSYKSSANGMLVTNNIRYTPTFPSDTMKFSSLKNKI